MKLEAKCKGILEYIENGEDAYDVDIQGCNAQLTQIEVKIVGLREKIFEKGKDCTILIKQ